MSLYADPGYAGASLDLDVGEHQLFAGAGLADAVSSIRVATGFVAVLYENADASGGFGRSVDLLEDCPDLGVMGLGDLVSYVSVFASARDIQSFNHGTGVTDTTHVVWARGSLANGQYVPGHWEAPRATGTQPVGPPVVSPGPLPQLLQISKLDGSSFVDPAFDTSAADWSSALVGGTTFDGSSAHSMEWVSVLNPTLEQDDEVGIAGFAVTPEMSGADLPFTHPFGPDFEFAIVPDTEYDALLAASNRDPAGPYAAGWPDARRAGLPAPPGILGLEVDGALVPPTYRPESGDRIALYGRWIVDAGHSDFHTEIHPPLVMARARAVNDQDSPAYPDGNATTLLQLWSRPYQAAQHFTDGSSTGLALGDYLQNIAETLGDIKAYPPVFAKSFDGIQLIAFTVRPAVIATAPARRIQDRVHLECSYSFTVNNACGVQVQQSPADPNAVVVILALNSVGLPALPELPNTLDKYTIDSLVAQIPGGTSGLTSLLIDVVKAWQSRFGLGEADIYVRRYNGPNDPSPAAQVVPFTNLADLPRSSVTVDNAQPFPVIGWLKLKWVYENLTIGNIGTIATGTVLTTAGGLQAGGLQAGGLHAGGLQPAGPVSAPSGAAALGRPLRLPTLPVVRP
ncbi:hypothetical protein [Rathayibacter soli]|uniref:hypothetical protein n=1 Tax=Rathayibacter soli TaxID=3144168 RepID=UPI0027E5A28F|nr:hypothetical protein [Glaciibacter superstes]